MKQAIAKRWVAALRSGKYKQGRAYLRDGDKFCCLGVLCDISKLAKWECKANGEWRYMGDNGGLSPKVRSWSGIKTQLADFNGQDLAAINDEGKRFSTIAKIIEKHWNEL